MNFFRSVGNIEVQRFISKDNDEVILADNEVESIVLLGSSTKRVRLPHTKNVLNKRITFKLIDTGSGSPNDVQIYAHWGQLIDHEGRKVLLSGEHINFLSVIANIDNWLIYNAHEVGDLEDLFSSSSSSSS